MTSATKVARIMVAIALLLSIAVVRSLQRLYLVAGSALSEEQ
jgi:hypothetical protein